MAAGVGAGLGSATSDAFGFIAASTNAGRASAGIMAAVGPGPGAVSAATARRGAGTGTAAVSGPARRRRGRGGGRHPDGLRRRALHRDDGGSYVNRARRARARGRRPTPRRRGSPPSRRSRLPLSCTRRRSPGTRPRSRPASISTDARPRVFTVMPGAADATPASTKARQGGMAPSLIALLLAHTSCVAEPSCASERKVRDAGSSALRRCRANGTGSRPRSGRRSR